MHSPYDLRFHPGQDAPAEVRSGRVGQVDVLRVNAPALTATRTPRLVRVSDAPVCKIHVLVRGRQRWVQGDQEASLAPGDFTLVDLSRTCRLTDHSDEHEVVVVRFPHEALPLRPAELERLTAVPISGRDGLGAPISLLAQHLAAHLDDLAPTEGERLATSLMDLVIVALAERLECPGTVAPAARRRVLLASVQRFIDQRLADPELSPGMIAAAHHVSLRYLYKLFDSQSATVAGWIRQRRLERCRRDLLDPALADRPVCAIGARWGLLDATTFSRAFRAAYGLPPAEYRLVAAASSLSSPPRARRGRPPAAGGPRRARWRGR